MPAKGWQAIIKSVLHEAKIRDCQPSARLLADP